MRPPLHKESEENWCDEIDNMAWSGAEKEISRWCQQNKVFDEITEAEIEEIWRRVETDEEERVRLNGNTSGSQP